MKIVLFGGGLGNQLYNYMYYKYLLKIYPNQKIYVAYLKALLKSHNGLEIEKWFEVNLSLQTSPMLNGIIHIIYRINRWLIHKKRTPFLCDVNGEGRRIIQWGDWQNFKYIVENPLPSFKNNLKLNDANKKMLEKIENCNSVGVHIRRGDYLHPSIANLYSGICTEEYYARAITHIRNNTESPVFFLFSDDIDFVHKHFAHIYEKTIVDINKGENAFFDMYLMAHCKHLIIANSTFSGWAAYLNQGNGMIISPSRWVNNGRKFLANAPNWVLI